MRVAGVRVPDLNVVTGRIVSVAIFIALWEWLSWSLDSPYMPSFFASAALLPAALVSSETYVAFSESLTVVIIGYLFSVLAALPTALICVGSRRASSVLLPVHEFIRYIPVAALVPLALVWLGVGQTSKAFLIFVGTYFQLVFLYYSDLRETPKEARETGLALGLSPLAVLLKIQLAESLPRIWGSSRIAFAWAWSYLLVAEVINPNEGVGFQLQQAVRFDQPAILVWLFLIGLLGLAVDGLFRAAGHRLFPWHVEKQA